jgi:mitochondrial fission protein ELM1
VILFPTLEDLHFDVNVSYKHDICYETEKTMNIRKLAGSGSFRMQTLLACNSAFKYKTPWPESASELHRPSDRLLSAKLVPNFYG